jgi:metal-responsive CopG/Arc/MetJ family transcriptional regulator
MAQLVVNIADEMKHDIEHIAKEEQALTESEIVRRMLKDGIEKWYADNKKAKKQ